MAAQALTIIPLKYDINHHYISLNPVCQVISNNRNSASLKLMSSALWPIHLRGGFLTGQTLEQEEKESGIPSFFRYFFSWSSTRQSVWYFHKIRQRDCHTSSFDKLRTRSQWHNWRLHQFEHRDCHIRQRSDSQRHLQYAGRNPFLPDIWVSGRDS